MSWESVTRSIVNHPRTRSKEVRLDPLLLELAPDDRLCEESVGRRILPPLPLVQALANVDALHATCNGAHRCGLAEECRRFDLYRDWLAPKRAYDRRRRPRAAAR